MAVWHANAAPWVRAVREQMIASRRLVTDRAILDAIDACGPRSAIDLGCGEGWLVRALVQRGIDALGVDAVPALIDAAIAAGAGKFCALDYAAIADGQLQAHADVVVCNFSLFGEASVEGLLRAVPRLLNPDGRLIIQTLHPLVAGNEGGYRNGWRSGSWQGCGEGFGDPAPWYFRTVSGWIDILADAGLRLVDLIEPLHPDQVGPASLIVVAEAA